VDKPFVVVGGIYKTGRVKDIMKLKCLSIVGARPQFIKAAPVSRRLKESGIREVIVHTGQHYDHNMSMVFFKELGIKDPGYNLGVGSLTHGAQTGRMMERIEKVLLKEEPGVVLVYGDTNSTLAGALSAVKLHIPIAHVESGLRGFNKKIPEEVNRILTDHISDILFCPTENAVKNLRNEGFENVVNNGKLVKGSFRMPRSLPLVVNTGDIMYDSLLFNLDISKKRSRVLKLYGLLPKGYYLATIHRAENTDDPSRLRRIFRIFNRIAKKCHLVIPLHPRTKKLLSETKGYDSNLKIIPPLSYLDMLTISNSARVILTDSGGLQKEAFILSVPCVTLRNETEWVETLRGEMNILAGVEEDKIIEAVKMQERKKEKINLKNTFGDGNAAEKIVKIIKEVIKYK
jgi:UDP-N-acetylglucosamine 2-epimerase